MIKIIAFIAFVSSSILSDSAEITEGTRDFVASLKIDFAH